MQNYSDLILPKKKLIQKYISEIGGNYTSTVISEKVKEKFNVIISERTVRYMVAKIQKDIDDIGETLERAIEEVNEQEKKSYEIFEKDWQLCYKLDTKKSIFVIPVAEIDAMFKDYSRKWKDMSEEQMRQKYNLKPQAWATIKNRLSLVKDSHIYSPYTLENSSEEEVDEMIEKGIEEHIDTKIGKFVRSYDKQFKEKAMKALKTVANFQYQLDMVQEAIAMHEPMELDFQPIEINEDEGYSHYVITDIHLWKTDTLSVINRLDAILKDIVSSKAKVIHITSLWDLVETLAQWGMHSWQIEYGTDPNYWYGFDALMKTVNIFEKWLYEIAKSWKKVYFKGITGNHWRFTQNKDNDQWRSWELIIYEMIKRWVSQLGIEVEYFKERINVFVFDGIQYIMHHWDGNPWKQRPEQLIVSHADFWMYTVILSWDKHNLKMSEGKNYTQIQIPALAGEGRYDKDMNLHSLPWYIKVVRNTYDSVDIIIKRLR
jgi:hypothetical protein